jgi:hypothetical protein
MQSAYVQRSTWKEALTSEITQAKANHGGLLRHILKIPSCETCIHVEYHCGAAQRPRPINISKTSIPCLLRHSVMNTLPKVKPTIEDRFEAAQRPQQNIMPQSETSHQRLQQCCSKTKAKQHIQDQHTVLVCYTTAQRIPKCETPHQRSLQRCSKTIDKRRLQNHQSALACCTTACCLPTHK